MLQAGRRLSGRRSRSHPLQANTSSETPDLVSAFHTFSGRILKTALLSLRRVSKNFLISNFTMKLLDLHEKNSRETINIWMVVLVAELQYIAQTDFPDVPR